jgi:excisionase family DNA binding protein
MAVHRNKVLDGAISNGHYHQRLPFVSQEVRLLSDHNLPPKKPSDRVQMDAGRSAVSGAFRPEPLLDSDEAAAIMKIHPKTLQRFARLGRIRGVHVGKLWRFRASEIDDWIDRQVAG